MYNKESSWQTINGLIQVWKYQVNLSKGGAGNTCMLTSLVLLIGSNYQESLTRFKVLQQLFRLSSE